MACGIVTALRSNGFFLQDPAPDQDPATSEGLFVFTSTAPSVSIGDSVRVTGRVTEFRPGGASSTNLTTTEITSPVITVLSAGNDLPAPIVIGSAGRVPPTEIIDNDTVGSVEYPGPTLFDPAEDGIDFYESLEGMRVQVNNAVAVSGTSSFGEIAVLADGGALAGTGLRTERGGIIIRPGDFNPERIIVDDAILTPAIPQVGVGQAFISPLVGVMDYSFGSFKMLLTNESISIGSANLLPDTAAAPGPRELSIAAFNVENLDPSDGSFALLAGQIVNHLRSPDILVLEEVQDNDGETNSGTVAADLTFTTLINAIVTAGGPAYAYRQVDPLNNQDGGAPGGNIRVGFLFNPLRVTFVDRGSATAVTATVPQLVGSELQLSHSPGRVDPTNPAFSNSRKPLAGEFLFTGVSPARKVFVIGNHF